MDPKQIPEGTQDLLPVVAQRKRFLEQEILQLFKGWGYQEIVTPTLEYFKSLSSGAGDSLQGKMYKLFDRKGEILALRAEMTTPIARLVASKLKNLRPAKLCYIANLFRYEDLQKGRYREFYQAGLEFIGGREPSMDAEIIALASKALKGAGLKEFTIHMGHMLFFQGLIKEYHLLHKEAMGFKEALMARDFVTFREKVEKSSLEDWQKENLLLLPSLQEKATIPPKAYQLANHPLSKEAIVNLEGILKYLNLLGEGDHCYVDLGLFRDLDYYSGMIFEGFSPKVGFNICGGGRYDQLLGEFGLKSPACGFALGLDRLLIALKGERDPSRRDDDVLILFDEDKEEEAYQLFFELKESHQVCELELLKRSIRDTIEYAKRKGISYLFYVGRTPPKDLQDKMIQTQKNYYSYDLLAGEGRECSP